MQGLRGITGLQRTVFAAFLIIAAFFSASFAPTASAVAPADFYGLTTFDQLTTDNEAEEMQRLGIHMVRLNIVWRDFQQANCNNENVTGLNFSTFDGRVQRAAEHNLTILGNFYGSRLPEKCPNGADLKHFPTRGTALEKDYVFAESGGFQGGFVWQVVQRYGQNGSFWAEHPSLPQHPIKIWEVWNETNLRGNNPDGKSIQPQEYAKLLIDTSYTIKKAQEVLIGQNPYNIGTRVLFGGLWGDSQYSNGDTFEWPMEKYMKAIYNEASGYTAAEAHAAFDGYSYHPYRLHGNAANVEETIGGTVPVREKLGDSGKSLWLTEIGWQVAFGEGLGLPSYSAQQVGDMLNEVLGWTYNNQGYLNAQYAATFVYQNLANPCGEVKCWPFYAGIKDASGTERPAWCRIANLVAGNGNACEFGPPYVSTASAAGIQTTQATLGGIVIPRGLKTRYTFQWGRTTSYTNENPVGGAYAGWTGEHAFSETITNLSSGTTYHYRIVATSAAGTSYGSDQTFTTTPSWNSDNLGGGITANPDVASWESGRLDVFARGTDNALWHRVFTGATGWSSWESLGGSLASGPGAVSWGPNRIDVFARAADNSLQHWVWNGSWHWENLGGAITSDPDVASWESGRLDVFAKGTSNTLMHRVWTNAEGWSGWENLGGSLASGPGAVSWGKTRIDVFAAQSGDSSVKHWFWPGP